MTTSNGFYVTGGTLSRDAISYVHRQADDLLYTSLSQGEYCSILTSRQMGKSSLMVRTAARLKEYGVQAAIVDLTCLGQNLTVEQWYKGMLNRIGQGLDIEDELDDFWYLQGSLPPLERWLAAVQKVILARIPDNIVLFIDEIDIVRSLPFRTDEFFAGIRACYNRREQDSSFHRLTFCLMGVAAPSDLIQDSHITPFNIGRRIDLDDFTQQEAETLTIGISVTGRDARSLLRQVLNWTGGQPYLTQRLCAVVAADDMVIVADDVDRLCMHLFLSRDAQQNETNLAFVRNRILKSGGDLTSTLDLYRRVLGGKRVEYDPIDPVCEVLRLSGIVRVVDGKMLSRNRIYTHVFDREWVQQNLPDAEMRRQAQAYRRGMLRTLSMTSIVVSLMGFLLCLTIRSERQASLSDRNSRHALQIARQERDNANRELYTASMYLAQRAYNERNIVRAEQLMEACRRAPGLAAYRGFEWRYLWGLIHQDRYTLVDHAQRVLSAAFSSDSRTLVTVDRDATIRRWSAETGNKASAFVYRYGEVSAASVSADAEIVGIATLDKVVLLHNAISGRVIRRLTGFKHSVCSIAFSRDGRLLATGTFDGAVTIWRIADGALLQTLPGHKAWCDALAFSTNGKTLFSSTSDGAAWFWDVATGRALTKLKGNAGRILAASFSPEGRALATGGYDSRVLLWNIARGVAVRELLGHRNRIMALAFSSDARTLATASADTTVKLWNVASAHELRTLEGHRDRVQCVAFSPNGHMIATGSDDRTTKLWDLTAMHAHHLGRDRTLISCLSFAPDGRTVAISGENRQVVIWNIATGHPIIRFDHEASAVAFAHDGRTLAIADTHGALTLREMKDRAQPSLHLINKAIWALDLSPIAHEAAIGSGDGMVTCIDTRTGRLTQVVSTHLSGIASVAFSPDGRLLAILDKEGAAVVVDYSTRSTLLTISRTGAQCCAFCFSPTKPQLAVGFSDGAVELWDIVAGRKKWSAQGHVGHIYALVFSPDGSTLATGSDDHMVRLWNVAVGHEVWTLQGHADSICGLTFTPDGRSLVSVDQGRTVIVWQAPILDTIPVPKVDTLDATR